MATAVDMDGLLTDRLIIDILKSISLKSANGSQTPHGQVEIHPATIDDSFVVAKSHHWYSIPYGYGEHFRVLIAIGGLESCQYGILTAKLFLMSMFLTSDFKLITYDIHGSTY